MHKSAEICSGFQLYHMLWLLKSRDGTTVSGIHGNRSLSGFVAEVVMAKPSISHIKAAWAEKGFICPFELLSTEQRECQLVLPFFFFREFAFSPESKQLFPLMSNTKRLIILSQCMCKTEYIVHKTLF